MPFQHDIYRSRDTWRARMITPGRYQFSMVCTCGMSFGGTEEHNVRRNYYFHIERG